jgi:hypothetical protein
VLINKMHISIPKHRMAGSSRTNRSSVASRSVPDALTSPRFLPQQPLSPFLCGALASSEPVLSLVCLRPAWQQLFLLPLVRLSPTRSSHSQKSVLLFWADLLRDSQQLRFTFEQQLELGELFLANLDFTLSTRKAGGVT